MICVKCQIGYRHFRADIEHLGIVRDIGGINLITGTIDCDVLIDINTRDQLANAQQRDRITRLRRGKSFGKGSVLGFSNLGDRNNDRHQAVLICRSDRKALCSHFISIFSANGHSLR